MLGRWALPKQDPIGCDTCSLECDALVRTAQFMPLEARKICKRATRLAHEREAGLRRAALKASERHEVGIDHDFPNDEAAVGLQDSEQLSERAVPIWDLAQGANQVRAVECAIGIRQARGVTLSNADVGDACFGGAPNHLFEHVRLHVHHVQHAVRSDGRCHRKSMYSDSRTDFENPLSNPRFKDALESLRGVAWSRQVEQSAERKRERRRVPLVAAASADPTGDGRDYAPSRPARLPTDKGDCRESCCHDARQPRPDLQFHQDDPLSSGAPNDRADHEAYRTSSAGAT